MFSIAQLFPSVSGLYTGIQKILLTSYQKKISFLCFLVLKGKKWEKLVKKRKTCSSTNSETSREISAHSAHNRSLLNVVIGDEILSEAISKANDVLYVVHCDDSEIKSSTPRVEADIREKLDELFRQYTLTNRKIDGIVRKLNKLDSIDRKLTTLESSVSNLGQIVKKIEVKHEEFQTFVKFCLINLTMKLRKSRRWMVKYESI